MTFPEIVKTTLWDIIDEMSRSLSSFVKNPDTVGIDVSKDKHDCFILSSEGEALTDVFTIPNTMDGFHCLLQRIQDCTHTQDKINP